MKIDILQQDGKYLFFSFPMYGGLDDQITYLEMMIITALSLKRVLIINETETDAQHRTSKLYTPFNWDNYIDLAQTKIAEIMPNKTIKEIKDVFRWVHEKDFDLKSYTKEQVKYIDGSQLYESENEHYPVLCVLHTDLSKIQKNREACLAKGLTLCGQIQSYCKISHAVSLTPSQKVNDLTDIVLHHFGTDRQSSLYTKNILHSKTRYRKHDFVINYYICMQLRAGDRVLLNKRNYLAIQKDQIRYIVKTVAQKHPQSPIYIMSDAKPSYFDFLKPKYKIYTYQDFPKLKELFFSTTQPVDHNLLYMVEKNIMRYALVQILAPCRNMLLFETDASYEVPANVSASFDALEEFRKQEWQALINLNRLDKLIMAIKNLKKKFKIGRA